MTANLVVFDTVDDLTKLTGLSRDKLWAYGFDLDDWDIGFQSDIDLFQYDEHFWWLNDKMRDCFDHTGTNYRGKYYYMVHHA